MDSIDWLLLVCAGTAVFFMRNPDKLRQLLSWPQRHFREKAKKAHLLRVRDTLRRFYQVRLRQPEAEQLRFLRQEEMVPGTVEEKWTADLSKLIHALEREAEVVSLEQIQEICELENNALISRLNDWESDGKLPVWASAYELHLQWEDAADRFRELVERWVEKNFY